MSTDLGGQKLGQYELRERLGRGGMADVYKAFQPGMERFVAIKVMLGHLASDAEFVERFRREARAVGTLRHPNIVSVFDFGIERDIYYMVMEFIRGENLKAYISSNPQGIPLDDALRIASQIADALDYAHKNGMIHRDVKPANIMFVDNSHQQAILTDFGIAQILSQPGLTASGAMVGTPAYLSPEVASGRSTNERADIYGLGIILYEMLTGRVPYEADTPLAIIMAHVNAPVPSPAEIGREVPDIVEAIILKAMAKNPDDRYQTAAEMKEAIDNARAILKDTSRRPVVTDDRTEKVQVSPKAMATATQVPEATESLEHQATTYIDAPSSKPPTLWIALGGIAAVAVIAVLLVLSQNRPPEPVVTPTELQTQVAEAVTEEATATEPEPTATQPEPSATDAPTEAPTEAPPTDTTVPIPTDTEVPTQTPVPTDTAVPTATATSTPTDEPTETPAPTEVAMLPANAGELREAGLLSGLSPLQDEIDAMLLDGEVDEAGERLDDILEADPENIDALAARAILLNQTADAETALADADKAIELAPESPLGYIARAEVMQNWAVDDDAATLEAAEQALALDPDNPEALWRASLAQWELGDLETAESLLNQAIAAGANGFRFADFAANFYFYNSQYEQAQKYMLIRYNSDPADEYYLRMLVANLLRLDQAEAAYEAVKNFPVVITDWDDLSAAAFVAYTAGDYAQAREWAETARALSDEAHAATYVLGLVSWYGDNDLSGAMGYFDQLANVEGFYDDFLDISYGHDLNLDRGRVLLAAGQYEQAVEAFTRALETAGYYPVVFEGLADAYLALGDGAAARDNLRLALENTYDNPEEQRRLLERIRMVGAVIASATAEPTAQPTEEAVTIGLLSGLTPLQDEIDMLAISEDWDEAERRIDAALEADPDSIEGLTARSLYRSLTGESRNALADANQIIELAPDSPLGYIARSDALFDGTLNGARQSLEAANEALEIEPGNLEALWRASRANSVMNYSDFLSQLYEAVEGGAQGFRFAHFAGEYLHYEGDYELAQPYLEVWYSAFPNDLYSTALLAANLIALDRAEEAHQTMQNYTGEYENYDQLAWPAYVAYRAGYYDEAREWAEQALRQERNAPGAHYVLGLISWYVDGDVNEARRHLEVLRGFPMFRDLFLNPDKGHEAQYDLGRILLEAGRTDDAITAFNRSLRNDVRPYTYEALADAYLAKNDTEAALENLDTARDMQSNDAEYDRLTERIAELGGE